MNLALLTAFYRHLFGSGPEFYYAPVHIKHLEGQVEVPVIDFQQDRVQIGSVTARHPLPPIRILRDVSEVRAWAMPWVDLMNCDLLKEPEKDK